MFYGFNFRIDYHMEYLLRRREKKMMTTGIIRRIDDLNRIVIPRNILRELNIKEGQPFEFYIDKKDNSIILKKYELNK